MSAGLTDAQLAAALKDPGAILRELDRIDCEESFYFFVKKAWPEVDPSLFVDGWHLTAIASHLQAVAEGRIRKLLINIPPRHSKTILTSVLFPAWCWIQSTRTALTGPQVKFMCLTYSDDFAMETATTARRLVEGEWFRSMWGDKVKIAKDQSNKSKFDTTTGGTRISASLNASHLGRGADIRIIDDPIKVKDSESQLMRSTVNRTYDEALTSRVTDPATSATIIIMQRLNEDDLSGHVLSKDPEFVHLCLPARYDSARHCSTVLGFDDPRVEDGELLWPARFDRRTIDEWASLMGPFAASGQLDQAPAPRGGGIIKRDWWQMWPPEGPDEGRWFRPLKDDSGQPILDDDGYQKFSIIYPQMEYIIGSLDTAFKTKEENDYSAMTVWGVFMHEEIPGVMVPKLLLMEAWRARLPFNELVERVMRTCRPRPGGREGVDALLIEDKASGQSVVQEVQRIMSSPRWVSEQAEATTWTTIPINPEGDKVARVHSIVPLFSNKMIFAPAETQFRAWAEDVIAECSVFPKGAHDDYVDSCSMALRYLRKINLAQLAAERQADDYAAISLEALSLRPRPEFGDDVGGY